MSLRLFTKTYAKDLPWFRLAFRSVLRCSQDQVREWIVATERDQVVHVQKIIDDEKPQGIFLCKVVAVEDVWPDAASIHEGYMRQQWIKMTAHRAIGERVFWNWDSDVIACRKFSVAEFCSKDHRPILWFSDLNQLMLAGYPPGRKHSLDHVFGGGCSFEFMRCMPIPINGGILRHAEHQDEWRRSFEECKRNNRAFSEFNVIGEFTHRFFPNAVHFKNAETEGPTWASGSEAIIDQKWSYGGVTSQVEAFVNAL